jgi:hypothetical protein
MSFSVKVNLFTVKQKDGSEKPLTSLDVLGKRIFTNIENDDKAEYLVRQGNQRKGILWEPEYSMQAPY